MMLREGKIRIGHDCVDPVDKMTRIREKAELIEEINETCRLAEEAVFGPPVPLVNRETNLSCQSCGCSLRYTEEQARYECTHCHAVWECLGVMDERPIWVCVFDPNTDAGA